MPNPSRTNLSTIHHRLRIGDPVIILGERAKITDLGELSATVKYRHGTVGFVPYALINSQPPEETHKKPGLYRRFTEFYFGPRLTAIMVYLLLFLLTFGAVYNYCIYRPPLSSRAEVLPLSQVAVNPVATPVSPFGKIDFGVIIGGQASRPIENACAGPRSQVDPVSLRLCKGSGSPKTGGRQAGRGKGRALFQLRHESH